MLWVGVVGMWVGGTDPEWKGEKEEGKEGERGGGRLGGERERGREGGGEGESEGDGREGKGGRG